jgi:hypothetical protein
MMLATKLSTVLINAAVAFGISPNLLRDWLSEREM